MSKTAEQVWQAFMESMHKGNEDWHKLLAEDIEFVGPAQQVKGKEDFIKLNIDFFKMVRGLDIVRHASSESLVATEAVLTVETPKGGELVINLAEFYQITDEKIQSVKIFYDPEEFKREFGM